MFEVITVPTGGFGLVVTGVPITILVAEMVPAAPAGPDAPRGPTAPWGPVGPWARQRVSWISQVRQCPGLCQQAPEREQ